MTLDKRLAFPRIMCSEKPVHIDFTVRCVPDQSLRPLVKSLNQKLTKDKVDAEREALRRLPFCVMPPRLVSN